VKKKYYIDTCIWRDHYENRYGSNGRPLGDYASKLLIKLIKEKHLMYFSDFSARELRKSYSEDEVNELLNVLFISGRIIKLDVFKEDVVEAKKLSVERNISFGDCLHAILARNSNSIILTQNKRDFIRLLDIVSFKQPEDLL